MQIWLELAKAPTAKTRELLSYIFESWYMLGRLGGFNAQNLQARAHQRATVARSYAQATAYTVSKAKLGTAEW